MDSPLTPGMSNLLSFGDDTFEYPLPEAESTIPGTNDLGIDGNRLIESRRPRSSPRKTLPLNATTSVQTPALTTGPSAVYPKSTSASQASPSVAPDYFTRPRRQNSVGRIPHFNTNSKLGESNDFSEFRRAIDNRFWAARSARADPLNDPSRQYRPATEQPTFTSSQYSSQPNRHDDFQHAQSSVALESVMLDSRADFPGLHDAVVDPALEPGPFAPASLPAPQHEPPNAAIPPKNAAPPNCRVIKRRQRRKPPPTAEVQAQKHKNFLERNREAASKCRSKKKSQVQDLEEREREGRAVNMFLKEEFKVVLGEALLFRERAKLLGLACASSGTCRARGLVQRPEDIAAAAAAAAAMDGIVHEGDRELGFQAGFRGPATAAPQPTLERSVRRESGSEFIANEDDEDSVERRRTRRTRRTQPNETRGEGVET